MTMGQPKSKKSLNSLKILLVEDDINTRLGLCEILQTEGHEVTLAENGRQALRRFSETTELLLCDFKLPGLSGLDVIRRLKKHHPTLMAIIMTAYSTPEAVNEAKAIGVYDWLSKPLNIEKLLSLIRETEAGTPESNVLRTIPGV